jgi:hypothetical protein
VISNPTRRRDGPLAISSRILDFPGKGFGVSTARRSFPARNQSSVYATMIPLGSSRAVRHTDNPGQTSLDGAYALVQVVTV